MSRTLNFAGRFGRGLWAAGLLAALTVVVAGLLGAAAAPARAQAPQPVPPLDGPLTDLAGVLDPAQRETVLARLAAQEAATGTQIAVLLLPSTQPEDIAAYAFRVADQWKIGRADVGDGVLIVVATADRRMRIEVARTLEGGIPDLAASRIIDETLRPAFRQGDYAGGLVAAIGQLEGLVRGEALPPPPERSGGASADSGWSFDFEDLVMFFFVAVAAVAQLLTRLLGRRLGGLVASGAAGTVAWFLSQSLWIAGGVAVVAWIVVGLLGVGGALQLASGRRGSGRGGSWGGSSGGSWGGGRSGGGGWSSGGGGSFGGGGASGSW